MIESARIPRDSARLLLVALSQAGMIEPADSPARRVATPSPTASVDATGGPAAVPDTVTPLSVTQLGLVAQTVRSQNHYWALGVRADDSTEVIDQAYEALARSFHPDRYRQRPDEDRRLAQEIFERLGEAHRVLRDVTRRRAYAARLEKQRPNDAVSGPIPGSTSTGSSNSGGAAKELFDTGMQHLRANRHREAVESFRQAARMSPEQADFRAALGWSLFREAPADARAGRAALAELRRAIQLDPKSRRARYYLGYFYAQSGQPDLAVAEFEKLLELASRRRRCRRRTAPLAPIFLNGLAGRAQQSVRAIAQLHIAAARQFGHAGLRRYCRPRQHSGNRPCSCRYTASLPPRSRRPRGTCPARD